MKDAYSRQALITLYPKVKREHIEQGDFKILVDEQGHKIARFGNMAICAPTHELVCLIVNQEFSGVPDELITYFGFGMTGLEISLKK
jgi:hypothetical protein